MSGSCTYSRFRDKYASKGIAALTYDKHGVGESGGRYRNRGNASKKNLNLLAKDVLAAIEVKLGVKQIDEAAANLIKLSEKVDKEKMNTPSFLMVLTGGQVSNKRPDGVLVVPIGCLRD
jgi:hypothetical protein